MEVITLSQREVTRYQVMGAIRQAKFAVKGLKIIPLIVQHMVRICPGSHGHT
jgi:hypothetical protein